MCFDMKLIVFLLFFPSNSEVYMDNMKEAIKDLVYVENEK